MIEKAKKLCDALRIMDDEEPSIRLVVAGGFSAGKSAFINHYLGREVAVEGASATTRSCTEYVYGPADSYTADGEEVSREEYLNLSKEEGTRRKFVVTLAADKLNGITLIDTPGIGNEQQETDFAKQAIYSADILLWLVNISDGTIRASDLAVLKDAVEKAKDIPLAFLLTFADIHKEGDICKVAASVQREATKNNFRVPYKPLPFSTLPPNKAKYTSARKYIEIQENKLEEILSDCRGRQRRNQESKYERLASVLNGLTKEFEESKKGEIGELKEKTNMCNEQIRKIKSQLKARFEKKLRNELMRCLDEIAEAPPLSAIRLSNIPNTGFFFDGDYRASFNRSGWVEVFGNRLAKYLEPIKTSPGFYLRQVNIWERAINDFVLYSGSYLSENIQPIQDGSGCGWAKENAQSRMRHEIASFLNQLKEEQADEIWKNFRWRFWNRFQEDLHYRWQAKNLDDFMADADEALAIIGEVQKETFPKYERKQRAKRPQPSEKKSQPDRLQEEGSLAATPEPDKSSSQVETRSPIWKDWYVISGILMGWAGVHLAYVRDWGGYCLSMLLLVASVWTSSWKIHLWHNIAVGLLLTWWFITLFIGEDVYGLKRRRISASGKNDDLPSPQTRSPSPYKRIVYVLLSILLGTTGLNGRYIHSIREDGATRALLWSFVFTILLGLSESETWTALTSLNILAMFMWNFFCVLFVDEDGDGRRMTWF